MVLATTPARIMYAPVFAKRLTPQSREQRWSSACGQVSPCNEGFSRVLDDKCTCCIHVHQRGEPWNED
jgi:hypothetical protein